MNGVRVHNPRKTPLSDVPGLLPRRAHYVDDVRHQAARTVDMRQSSAVVVYGPPRSGRSTLVSAMAESATRLGATVVPLRADQGVLCAGGPARPSLLRQPGHPLICLLWDDVHSVSIDERRRVWTATRHLSRPPALWIAATDAVDDARHLAETLVGEVGPNQVRLVELAPLTTGEVISVIESHIDAKPSPELVRLLQVADGAVGDVVDLTHALLDGGFLVEDAGHLVLKEGYPPAAPGGRLRCPNPVPKPVRHYVEDILSRLDTRTVNLLRVAAILGGSFQPEEMSHIVDDPIESLLEKVGVLFDNRILCADGGDFSFRCESIWRVVLNSIPDPVRVLMHAQVHQKFQEAPGQESLSLIHLIRVARPGDRLALNRIRDAGPALIAQDPATALSLVRRAQGLCQLSDDDVWAELQNLEVEALVRLGSLDEAAAVLAGSLTTSSSRGVPRLLAAAKIEVLRGNLETAAGILHTAPADFRREDRVHLASSALLAIQIDPHPVDRAAAAERVSRSRRRPWATLTAQSMSLWAQGRLTDAVTGFEGAVELASQPDPWGLLQPVWSAHAIYRLMDGAAGADDRVRSLLAHLSNTECTLFEGTWRQRAILDRGVLGASFGSTQAALVDEPFLDSGLPARVTAAETELLRQLHRGEVDDASRFLAPLPNRHDAWLLPWLPSRALLRGRIAAARDDLRGAWACVASAFADDRTSFPLLLSDGQAAVTIVRWLTSTDDYRLARVVADAARRLVDTDSGAHVLRRVAEHAQALVRDDLDRLGETAGYDSLWAQLAWQEDLARMRLRDGDSATAAEMLQELLDSYARVGATMHLARLGRQLRTLGVRRRPPAATPRGSSPLTATEERVARLISEGLTNREAAERLFVSVHTISFHLRHIYQKLGIRGRGELIQLRIQDMPP